MPTRKLAIDVLFRTKTAPTAPPATETPPPNVSKAIHKERGIRGGSGSTDSTGSTAWPYTSTSLTIAMLDLPASHLAIWWRGGSQEERRLLYRLTPDVYAWLVWKMGRADEQWWAMQYAVGGAGGAGAAGGDSTQATLAAMQVVADRIPALLDVAGAFEVAPAPWTLRPPQLPPPPCPLAHLEYLDRFERWMRDAADDPGGRKAYARWVDRRMRSRE
jgi:hypothetical protein